MIQTNSIKQMAENKKHKGKQETCNRNQTNNDRKAERQKGNVKRKGIMKQ